ncbi:hypothetical protein DE146DRAFT_776551 [Phaeosphaeria sp. MPI-PUGE-AT-0046c]|nr:hypothetical protein DE146DRAFT_776551 [Phaeosphaeria sp. MPI-PUGE-AT-0046c]
MKYAAAILALAIGAFAVPQASITAAPAVSVPIPSGLTSQVSCALMCAAGDVMCQASCLGNARPNASQVIDTNNCAAKCDQGDGSPAAAKAFEGCVQGCINSLFPSSQTAFGAGGAQGASSMKAGATGSVNPTAAASAGNSASGSGNVAQSTGAADSNSVRLAGAGLAGLFAIFAL